MNKGDAKLLAYIGDESPWQLAVAFTGTKTANEQADKVQRFLHALRHATQDYHDAFTGPDGKRADQASAPDAARDPRQTHGQIGRGDRQGLGYMDAEARLDEADVLKQVAWYRAQGMVKDDFDAAEHHRQPLCRTVEPITSRANRTRPMTRESDDEDDEDDACADSVVAGIGSCTAATATPGVANDKVKAGVVRSMGGSPNFVAKEKGFFAEQGIDVDIVFFNSAQPIAIAVASGDCDVGTTGVTAAFFNLAAQGTLSIVGSGTWEHPASRASAIWSRTRLMRPGCTR